MSKTHYKQLMNPDYFGAYALPDGNDLTVKIKKVERKTVKMAGGKSEDCTICQLYGHKPLILNATNGKTIAKLYGPFVQDWEEKQITMFASTTKFGGDIVECVRIRPVAPCNNAAPQKKQISDERLEKAIQAIKDGSYKLEQMQNFDLTPEQNERLNKEFSNDQDQAARVEQDYDGYEEQE